MGIPMTQPDHITPLSNKGVKPSTGRQNRRSFLKSTLAVASLPQIVLPSTLGRGATPPSERITIGFIGAGKMARGYHMGTLLKFDDVQALAVCEVDLTRRDSGREKVNAAYAGRGVKKGCDTYNHYRDVLAREDIDAVVIATPDHWHAIPVIEACQAGKDVYCEKPLTLTLEESRLCIEAVRKHRRVFQTGSQQRSSVFGPFRQACEIIRSGRIGKVKKVSVGVGEPSIPCDLPAEDFEPGLDWDLWLGAAPARPYHSALSPRGVHNHFPQWRRYREYSGGGHTDMGAHHYDIAHWALDLDGTGPVEIMPPSDPKAMRGVRYRYENGIEIVHGGPGGCFFEGTEGSLRIDRGHLSASKDEIVKEPIGENDIHLYRSPGHHRDWLNCIRSRQDPVAPVEAGARTVSVIHLGNLAYWNRRKLSWNPKKWEFVNDSEANRWRDRERRDPWQLPSV